MNGAPFVLSGGSSKKTEELLSNMEELLKGIVIESSTHLSIMKLLALIELNTRPKRRWWQKKNGKRNRT